MRLIVSKPEEYYKQKWRFYRQLFLENFGLCYGFGRK